MLEVNINGIKTRVLIDLGSLSSLKRMEEYRKGEAQDVNAKMEDSHERLCAYGGKELEVIGWFTLGLSVCETFLDALSVSKEPEKAEASRICDYLDSSW